MLTVNAWLFFSLVKKGWWDYDRLMLEYFTKRFCEKDNSIIIKV